MDPGVKKIMKTQYLENFHTNLYQLQQEGLYCDVVLQLGETELNLHSLVLSCCSPKLDLNCHGNQLTMGVNELLDVRKWSLLHGEEESVLNHVVRYMYTGCLEQMEDLMLKKVHRVLQNLEIDNVSDTLGKCLVCGEDCICGNIGAQNQEPISNNTETHVLPGRGPGLVSSGQTFLGEKGSDICSDDKCISNDSSQIQPVRRELSITGWDVDIKQNNVSTDTSDLKSNASMVNCECQTEERESSQILHKFIELGDIKQEIETSEHVAVKRLRGRPRKVMSPNVLSTTDYIISHKTQCIKQDNMNNSVLKKNSNVYGLRSKSKMIQKGQRPRNTKRQNKQVYKYMHSGRILDVKPCSHNIKLHSHNIKSDTVNKKDVKGRSHDFSEIPCQSTNINIRSVGDKTRSTTCTGNGTDNLRNFGTKDMQDDKEELHVDLEDMVDDAEESDVSEPSESVGLIENAGKAEDTNDLLINKREKARHSDLPENCVNENKTRVHRKCHRCHENFKTGDELRNHRMICKSTLAGTERYRHTKCRHCQKSFPNHEQWKMHVEGCRNKKYKSKPYEKAWSCENCSHTFATEKRKFIHMRTKHQMLLSALVGDKYKILACQETGCSYETLYPALLKVHLNTTHAAEGQFVCDECGQRMKSKMGLDLHKRIHSGEKPCVCNQCGSCFRQPSILRGHMLHVHQEKRDKPFLCEECEYRSFTARQLQCHRIKSHGLSISQEEKYIYKCEHCIFVTYRKKSYENHKRRHTDLKPFECNVCHKTYTCENDLKGHMKWHGEKTFKCPYEGCAYATVAKDKLQTHIRLMHTHKGEKPHACGLCSYSTAVKGNVTKHMRNVHQVTVVTGRHHVRKLGPSFGGIISKSAEAAVPSQSFSVERELGLVSMRNIGLIKSTPTSTPDARVTNSLNSCKDPNIRSSDNEKHTPDSMISQLPDACMTPNITTIQSNETPSRTRGNHTAAKLLLPVSRQTQIAQLQDNLEPQNAYQANLNNCSFTPVKSIGDNIPALKTYEGQSNSRLLQYQSCHFVQNRNISGHVPITEPQNGKTSGETETLPSGNLLHSGGISLERIPPSCPNLVQNVLRDTVVAKRGNASSEQVVSNLTVAAKHDIHHKTDCSSPNPVPLDLTKHTESQSPALCIPAENLTKHTESQSPVLHIPAENLTKHNESQSPVLHIPAENLTKHNESQSPALCIPAENLAKHNESPSPVLHIPAENLTKHTESQAPVLHIPAENLTKHTESQSPVLHIPADNLAKHNESQSPAPCILAENLIQDDVEEDLTGQISGGDILQVILNKDTDHPGSQLVYVVLDEHSAEEC